MSIEPIITKTRNMLVAVGNDTAGYQIYACSDPTLATTDQGWSVGFIGIKGAKGDPGNAGAINTVSATGLDAGQNPTVTNEGTASVADLVFGIPKGDQGEKGDDGERGETGQPGPKGEDGDDGEAGKIVSISATPLDYDEDPTASNMGSDTEAEIVLGIPRGIPGQDGQPGQQGQPGDPGQPGADGADGEAGKIISISANALPYTDQPTVRNDGSDTEAEIVLGIPAGVPGQDGQPGENGQPGADGTDGEDGFSPEITIKTQNPTTYILTIKTKDDEFDTMNLKGADGAGSPQWGGIGGDIDDQDDLKLILEAINNAIATKQIKLTEANAGDNISIDISNPDLPIISATGTLSEVAWGDIIGDWENQEDLKDELDTKQIKLTQNNAGDNITINDVDEDNIIISADIITSYESLTDLPTLNGEEIKGTVTLSAEDIPSTGPEGDSNVQTDLTSLNTDVTDLKQDVETLTTDLDGKVSLISSTTQVIDSDLALAEGKKFLGTASDQTEHELIGINEYTNGQQVEVGSETIPICINHKEVENWSDIHPSVNYKDKNGTEHDEKLTYLSELNTVNDNLTNAIGAVSNDFHSNAVFGKEIQPQAGSSSIIIVNNDSMPVGKVFEGQFELDGWTYGMSILKIGPTVNCNIWVLYESGTSHLLVPGTDFIFQKNAADGIVAMWKSSTQTPILKFKTTKYESINYISGLPSGNISSPTTINITGTLTPAKKSNLDSLSSTVTEQGISIANLENTYADESQNGLQTKENYAQIISNTQTIQHLQGLSHLVKVSFQTVFSTSAPTDEAVKEYLATLQINEPDYTITFLTNLDSREEWQYDTNLGIFRNAGQELVNTATNEFLGVVKGSTTDGRISVAGDGTLDVNGWSVVGTTATNLEDHTTDDDIHVTSAQKEDWTSKLPNTYVPSWTALTDLPQVMGVGSTAEAARLAIGAGTSSLIIGSTGSTAKAGDWMPTWANITGKPVVIGAGATAADARTAIGAGTSSLVIGTTAGTAVEAVNGTAAKANTLATARAINGVNFDGSAAISVPTVISRATVSATYTAINSELTITAAEKFNILINSTAVTNVNILAANTANQLDKTIFFKFASLPSSFKITLNSGNILQPGTKNIAMTFWDLAATTGVIIQLTQLDTSNWLLTNYISGVTY